MIKIRALSYAYLSDTPVLDGIDLDLRPGERVTVLGANGSGKSTFLKCIAGLLSPTQGTVTVPDSYRTGLVFQNPDDQIVSPVVESEIAFGLENLGVPHPEMVERVDEILHRFDLIDFGKHDPHSLSGGERQRLAIGGIVVLRPDFILFDEPYSMLDPSFRDEIRYVIHSLHGDGLTPIVVAQDPDDALGSDRLIVFDKGQIVLDGKPEEILSRPEKLKLHRLSTTTSGRLAAACGHRSPVPVTHAALTSATLELPQLPSQESPTPAMSPSPIVQVIDLCFTYNSGEPHAHQALFDVDFSLDQGEFVSLMGPSGSGKSTFALHLNGLHIGESGRVIVDGLDVSDSKSHDDIRQKVGLVFQFPEMQLFAETVEEDVAYGPANLDLDSIPDRVDRALASVGLEPDLFRRRNPFTLSGGERRRVALAGILATNPSVLVLDEPSAGLDPSGADELDRILQKLSADGTTILLVTHDLSRAVTLSDRIVVMQQGRVSFNASVDTTLANRELLQDLGIPTPSAIELVDTLRASGLLIPSGLHTSDQLARAVRLGSGGSAV